jgi:hypothetical protein
MPTLDTVSSSGDPSSRVSDALDRAKLPERPERPEPPVVEHAADWDVDDHDDPPGNGDAGATADRAADHATGVRSDQQTEVDHEPYVLPEIVPATADVDVTAPAVPHADLVAVPPALPTAPTAVAPAPASIPAAAPLSTPPRPRATGWGDHMTSIPAAAPGATLRDPGRRPRVRRVTRVLRHIDPWSTFKVGLLFSAVAYVVLLTAGVLLWRVADDTGTLANVERWFTQFGWETFELKGGEVFHNAWIIGLFGVVFLTGALVLLATLFNLVSDIVGGVRLTVLEEEVVERTVSSTRRYVVRRSQLGADGASVPAPQWDVDDEPGDVPPGGGGATALVATDGTVDDEPTRRQPTTG